MKKNKRFYHLVAIVTLVLLLPLKSFSWDNKGHATISEVAFNYLDANTKKSIMSYLNGMSIEEAANCMDDMRDDHSYDYMKTYHYVNFEKGIIVKNNSGNNIIFVLVQIGLKAILSESFHYKKAGVIVMGLTPNSETQLSLFNASNPKHQPLMSVIDKMNKSFGTNKVKFATQSTRRQWKIKLEKLSACFTTRINEIIKIKI